MVCLIQNHNVFFRFHCTKETKSPFDSKSQCPFDSKSHCFLQVAVVDTIVAKVQGVPGDDRCVLMLGKLLLAFFLELQTCETRHICHKSAKPGIVALTL